jgi:large subunit ribosomal protein L20
MPRSVNSVASKARRKKMFKAAKGYWLKRKNVLSVAKNAVDRGWEYAYAGRKQKKRDYRALWIVRINAALRPEGMNYSTFIGKLNKSDVGLNRKALADLAMNHPEAFKAVVQKLK